MKHFIAVFMGIGCLALPSILFAAASPGTLDAAKEGYNAAVSKIEAEKQGKMEAITAEYAKQLNALLDQYIAQRKLEEALLVQKELERMRNLLPVSDARLRENLLLHLTFDQPEANGRVTDKSGKLNHGQANAVTWTAQGKKGGAYTFNPNNSSITIPNSDSVNPKRITMAAWIKTSNMDGKWRRIFDKGWETGYALSIGGDTDGKPEWRGRLMVELGGKPLRWDSSDTVVADGQWHHVAVTYDGEQICSYVDGKPNARPKKASGDVASTSFDLVIGCCRYATPAENNISFGGTMDEVMMFNCALTPKEVEALCTRGM